MSGRSEGLIPICCCHGNPLCWAVTYDETKFELIPLSSLSVTIILSYSSALVSYILYIFQCIPTTSMVTNIIQLQNISWGKTTPFLARYLALRAVSQTANEWIVSPWNVVKAWQSICPPCLNLTPLKDNDSNMHLHTCPYAFVVDFVTVNCLHLIFCQLSSLCEYFWFRATLFAWHWK